MNSSEIACLVARIEAAVRAGARDPAYWTPERLAALDGSPRHRPPATCELLRVLAERESLVPAVAGLLGAAAHDSDEFAEVLEVTEHKIRDDLAGPIKNAVKTIGASDPDLALRIAERLLERDGSGYAYMLIGGAAAKLPSECWVLMQDLLDSSDARLQQIAIKSMVVAYADPDDRSGWDVLGALERVYESDDEWVGAAAIYAFVKFYPEDRPRCISAIERLARRHRKCALYLAILIRLERPFDAETSLNMLAVCSESSDIGVTQEVQWTLGELAGRHLEALGVTISCVEKGGYGQCTEYVLKTLGEAHKAGAVRALLDAPTETLASINAPRMAMCLVASAGRDALKPIFQAILSKPGLHMIGLVALHEVVSDPHVGGAARDSMLADIEDFLKRFAKPLIDVDRAVKGHPNRAARCARLILAVQNRREANYERARKNVDCFSALRSLLGKPWIDKSERDRSTHPLLLMLGQEFPPKGAVGNRQAGICTHAERARWFLYNLDRDLELLRKTLHDASYAKRLKNEGEFSDTISEMAFVMQFLGKCEIEPEPRMKSKKLDVRLEICGRPLYVEVLSPGLPLDLQLFLGARAARNRICDKMRDKIKNQLSELGGQDPAIIAINIGKSDVWYGEVEECLAGRSQRRTVARRGGAESYSERADGELAQDPDYGAVSAVVCYEERVRRDGARGVEYKIIANPRARVRLDEPAVEFLKKCLGGWRK